MAEESQERRRRDPQTATAVLTLIGGLSLGSLALGVIAAIANADTETLLGLRGILVLAAFAGVGLASLLLARALHNERHWAPRAATLGFCVLAAVTGAWVVWYLVEVKVGDGGGYVLLGGLLLIGASAIGLVSLLPKRRSL